VTLRDTQGHKKSADLLRVFEFVRKGWVCGMLWQGDALPLSYSRSSKRIVFLKVVERNVPLFLPLCPEALHRPCFHHQWTLNGPHLPLKQRVASRYGLPFSRCHGTGRHDANPGSALITWRSSQGSCRGGPLWRPVGQNSSIYS